MTTRPSSDPDHRKRQRQQRKTWNPDFVYDVDYNDHFETPFVAYQDLLPLLLDQQQKLIRGGGSSSSSKSSTIIYDPYYCDGRTKIYLHQLGFHKVQHEKRDFYRDIRNGTVPDYDVLVTNPPFSDTHKEQCLQFCIQRFQEHGTPFFLLMPNYVAARGYYRTTLGDNLHDVAYLIPSQPYQYDHPEGTGHEVSPFDSLWFCGVGREFIPKLKQAWEERQRHDGRRDDVANNNEEKTATSSSSAHFLSSLEDLVARGIIAVDNRPNPRQRKKRRRKQMMTIIQGLTTAKTDGTANGDHAKSTLPPPQQQQEEETDRASAKYSYDRKKNSKYRDKSGKRNKKRF